MSDSQLQPHQSDYRLFLEQLLRSRKARNASYSLRCFARDIGLSPSRVTEIFQGKDGLSNKKAMQVADRLGLTAFERELFLAMVEAQSGRSPVTRRMAAAKLKSMNAVVSESKNASLIREDCIAMLSGWHHFALIELTRLPGFRSDSDWISRRLSIPVSEVDASVERLLRSGLLKRVRKKLVATEQRFATTSDVPSSAIKDYHAGILQRAVNAVDLQRVDEREYAASFFSIDTADLPAVKEEMRAARRKIVRKYEEKMKNIAGSDDESRKAKTFEVYCLANQLFRVSTPEDFYEGSELH